MDYQTARPHIRPCCHWYYNHSGPHASGDTDMYLIKFDEGDLDDDGDVDAADFAIFAPTG